MEHLVKLAREGKKDEFKAAMKVQLNERRDAALGALKVAMAKTIGQKK